MTNADLNLLLVVVFLGILVMLGVRPHIAPLYRLWYGVDIGAWNMFQAKVDVREAAFLIGPDRTAIQIPHWRYFWHKKFVSTTYSHLDPRLVPRFAEFLAQRREVVRRLPKGANVRKWSVVYVLAYRTNNGPWIQIEANEPLSR